MGSVHYTVFKGTNRAGLNTKVHFKAVSVTLPLPPVELDLFTDANGEVTLDTGFRITGLNIVATASTKDGWFGQNNTTTDAFGNAPPQEIHMSFSPGNTVDLALSQWWKLLALLIGLGIGVWALVAFWDRIPGTGWLSGIGRRAKKVIR